MSSFREEIKEEISSDEKGQVREKKSTLNGKLEGEYTSYYGNGKVMAHLYFRNGRRDGDAVSHYREGQVKEVNSRMTSSMGNMSLIMRTAR